MISKKKDPALWNRAKKSACRNAGLCKHSARKMQHATRLYQKWGGKYKGAKSSRNSLRKWTRQKWRTSNGLKSKGKTRYLPSNLWEKLSKRDIKRTNDAKRRGFKKGIQYVKQPKDIVSKIKKIKRSNFL